MCINQADSSKNKGKYTTYVNPSTTTDSPPFEQSKTPIGKTIELGGQHTTVGTYGWICPVCGRGLSPFTSMCPCKSFEPRITWTTTPYVYNPGPTCTAIPPQSYQSSTHITAGPHPSATTSYTTTT